MQEKARINLTRRRGLPNQRLPTGTQGPDYGLTGSETSQSLLKLTTAFKSDDPCDNKEIKTETMVAKTVILYLKYLKAVNDLSTKDTNI